MDNGVLIAIITGGLSLIGTAVGAFAGIKKSNDLVIYRLEALENEVKSHNNFARRLPVVEDKIEHIEDDIKELKRK